MVNLIIKKYGFLGNKQKYKCKKTRRQTMMCLHNHCSLLLGEVSAERSEDKN